MSFVITAEVKENSSFVIWHIKCLNSLKSDGYCLAVNVFNNNQLEFFFSESDLNVIAPVFQLLL